MSIFKPFNKRVTRRLTEPVIADTALAPWEVEGLVGHLVATSTERAASKNPTEGKKGLRLMLAESGRKAHLFLERGTSGEMFVSWCETVWVARVRVGALGTGGSRVECEIVRWEEKDGELAAKEMYQEFLHDMARGLTASPP